jgi:hypothetical protein
MLPGLLVPDKGQANAVTTAWTYSTADRRRQLVWIKK